MLSDSGLIHANIGIDSIFVDRSGDWKLGSYDNVVEHASLANPSVLISLL
jgi:hypothetical protein